MKKVTCLSASFTCLLTEAANQPYIPLACSPKIEPSVMRVPGVSRVYDSHEKKKTYPRTNRQKASRC